MAFKAIFKDYQIVEKHVEYLIEVISPDSKEAWTFRRRYSTMRNWYNYAKSVLPDLPSFPKKKLFGNLSQKFILKRKNELEKYFAEILKKFDSPLITEFFRPRDSISSLPTQVNNEENRLSFNTSSKYLSIIQDFNEKMIDMSDINSFMNAGRDTVCNQKYNIDIISNFKYMPKGCDENLNDFESEDPFYGHWVRKRMRGIMREIKKVPNEKLLIVDYS